MSDMCLVVEELGILLSLGVWPVTAWKVIAWAWHSRAIYSIVVYSRCIVQAFAWEARCRCAVLTVC